MNSTNPHQGTTMNDNTTMNAANNLIDRAAQHSDTAIHAGTDAAQHALDSLSQSARQLQADAGHLSQRGLDALRDSTRQLRINAHRASERTVGYIQDEPVKAVLFAAVAGAALVVLLGLTGRSRH